MEKHVSLGMREEVIECDTNITYQGFLSNIEETFNLKEDTFSVFDLTEYNFSEMITIQDKFNLVRSEKDLARERLNGKNRFEDILTIQEAEDFFLLYEYKVNEEGNTPLSIASELGRMDIVKLILDKDFDNVHQEDNTPISWAAYNGHYEMVKLLLEKNFVNIHQEDCYNRTPLYWAESYQFEDIIKLLKEDIVRREKEK